MGTDRTDSSFFGMTETAETIEILDSSFFGMIETLLLPITYNLPTLTYNLP